MLPRLRRRNAVSCAKLGELCHVSQSGAGTFELICRLTLLSANVHLALVAMPLVAPELGCIK